MVILGDPHVPVISVSIQLALYVARLLATRRREIGTARNPAPPAAVPARPGRRATDRLRGGLAVLEVLGVKAVPNRVDSWVRSGNTTGPPGTECCPGTCES